MNPKNLNKYFEQYYKNPDKIFYEKDAHEFLSHYKLDILFKILYCEFYLGINKSKINKILYYLHLKRWQNFIGKDSNKFSYKDYIDSFHSVIESIKSKNFQSTISIIPVNQDNFLIDGSHRLATSVVLNKTVDIYKFNTKSPSHDLNRIDSLFNFKKYPYILDYLIMTFIKYNKNLRIFILFPIRDKSHDKEAINVLQKYGDIVMTKSLNIVSKINAYHITKNFYFGAEWIGNLNNGYKGALWKSQVCFSNQNPRADIILFSPRNGFTNKDGLKQIKEEIRSLYKIRFHSIHSSDDQSETIRYSKLFFHELSNTLLSKRKNNFFIQFENLLETLIKEKINENNFVFSGSTVLAALGCRRPKDFDVIHLGEDIPHINLSSHNSQLRFLRFKKNELIFNPKNYFYYMGFKFLKPSIVLELKRNRYKIKPEAKDLEDIKTLEEFTYSLN